MNNDRSTMRMFFSWALDYGLVRANPARRVEKFRETKREIRALEPEQEKALLSQAMPIGGLRLHGFVLCLLQSGLRRGTVAQLEWKDIDFELGEWRIPAEKMKSRTDFIGRPVAPELLQYLRKRRQPSGVVFGPLGAKEWQALVEATGLSWLRPHDLRRNFVTRCRRAGVPLEVAMYLSDHRDLAVVLQCYRRVEPKEAKQAIVGLFGQAAGG